MKKEVNTKLFEPIGPYSHAVRVGAQIFISGTPGVDPVSGKIPGDSAYLQTRQILRNFQELLAAEGATLDDLVHVQVNLVNVQDFDGMNRAYAEVFAKPYPARTVIAIAALPKPGALLTMNAIAVVS